MAKVSDEYRAARRAHLIETARDLFAHKGIADTSMSDLVTASGMSIGGIYRYFASRDELVAAVAEGRDGTVDGGFPLGEDPAEILSRLLSYVSGPEGADHARLTTQIWGCAAVQPTLAEIARARHTALRDYLAARIRSTPQPETADGAEGAEGADATDAADAADAAFGPEANDTPQSDTDLAEVLLAALVGYASLVAAGFDIAPAPFLRTLRRLLCEA